MRVLFALLALVAVSVSVSAQGLTGPNFYITGQTNSQSYTFTLANGTTLEDPSFTLTVGTTYKFILNATLGAHPFGFSVDSTSMTNLTDPSLGGVTYSGSCDATVANAWVTLDAADPCIVTLTPTAGAVGTPLYYRCSVHAAMIGTLTAVNAAGGSTSTPTPTSPSGSNGTTTATPTTGSPTTTPAPTTPPKNGAAVIVPGAAAALVIAAINALFSE